MKLGEVFFEKKLNALKLSLISSTSNQTPTWIFSFDFSPFFGPGKVCTIDNISLFRQETAILTFPVLLRGLSLIERIRRLMWKQLSLSIVLLRGIRVNYKGASAKYIFPIFHGFKLASYILTAKNFIFLCSIILGKLWHAYLIMFSYPSSRLKLFIQLIDSIDFGISLINFHFSEFEYFAMNSLIFSNHIIYICRLMALNIHRTWSQFMTQQCWNRSWSVQFLIEIDSCKHAALRLCKVFWSRMI